MSNFLINSAKSLFLRPALLLATVSFVLWSFYYAGQLHLNNIAVMTWVLGGILFYLSTNPKFKLSNIKKSDLVLFAAVSLFYFVSHLWNFPESPWNSYGLFDDAAWDIYFAKNHVFAGMPFQPAYFDTVGYISREVVFHYYISIFFKLFGYNLLTFNISLLILGFVTVLFTTLIVDKLFRDKRVTILAFLIINFFPLQYMHIFMGHRYAIAAPLMTVSLYFLYTGFRSVSLSRLFISALFAFLCWSSAIMGKQYIYALLGTVVLLFLFNRNHLNKERSKMVSFYAQAFLVCSIPLLTYVIFNYREYSGRESGLVKDFVELYKNNGFSGVKPYLDKMFELFFAKHSFLRQFLSDYPIIPLAYYSLLLPGIVIATIKNRYELLFMSVIPSVGAFVSGAYDFRVLISVPIWVICIAYTLNYMFLVRKKSVSKAILLVIVLLVTMVYGILPSALYIYKVSLNPNHIYLLPHKDVAVSRVAQGIVAGSETPSDNLMPNELNRTFQASSSHDTLICPFSAYAIIHLYLQDFDDKKILSLCDQGIQLLKSPEEILSNNLLAINDYQYNGKDLKLVWEESEKSTEIINKFSYFKKYGSEERIAGIVDGNEYNLYVLTIDSENIASFKNEILLIH